MRNSKDVIHQTKQGGCHAESTSDSKEQKNSTPTDQSEVLSNNKIHEGISTLNFTKKVRESQMKVYELIQRLSEAPADMEVLVNVVADDMDYWFEDRDGRERCIGVDFDKHVEVLDAFERSVRKEQKMVIDLYAL